MDSATCNVIYVDRNVREDRLVLASARVNDAFDPGVPAEELRLLEENLALLHDTFGDACISTLFNLHDISMMELRPTMILMDTPYDDRLPEQTIRSGTPSPRSTAPDAAEAERPAPDDDLYGLNLLQKIFSEAHARNLSKLIVPIPLIPYPKDRYYAVNCTSTGQPCNAPTCDSIDAAAPDAPASPPNRIRQDRQLLKVCLDLGATDVMRHPMNAKCITNLEVHAYKAHRDAAKEQQAINEVRRGRKRSWVGVNEEKPYAYLREAMVSGLMNGICRLGEDQDDGIDHIRISVSSQQQAQVAEAVGAWYFCAHEFSDDELVIAGSVMFRHALSMPELEKWRLPTDQLTSFLIACRAAYNSFVPYHNFRHVIDVLQATFHFLIRLGALPSYPPPSTAAASPDPPSPSTSSRSPMAALITPFEALTLLVTAIGHDVGHPGVNNGFLVALNAPLAQLYNDRSVLESFHCAAYSQILRRHWPAAFEDSKMRSLMISSILATDMGLHFDYMKRMGCTQGKLQEDNPTEGWNGRMREEQRALACALLIKCADISNVARKHTTALQWMHILSDEFSRQAAMEGELEIPSSLMLSPRKDAISLTKAQLGFMNLFAIPLFQGVADLMPAMQYCLDELEANKTLSEAKLAEEQAKQDPEERLQESGGTLSPRTMSIAVPSSNPAAGNPGSPREAQPPPPPPPPSATAATQKQQQQQQTSSRRGGFAVEQQADPIARQPSHVPDLTGDHDGRGMNRLASDDLDSVAAFAASDPFNVDDDERRRSPAGDQQHQQQQRRSETTEGSNSAPSGGAADWASQVTSATTGKMLLSPSTQGTSIISRDSFDRPGSVLVASLTAPTPLSRSSPSEPRIDSQKVMSGNESIASSTTSGKLTDGSRTVKKKNSRFRMNAFPFFRRHHRGHTSPTLSASDAG